MKGERQVVSYLNMEQLHKLRIGESAIEAILDCEAKHIAWLETQSGLVGRLGLENFLQSQL